MKRVTCYLYPILWEESVLLASFAGLREEFRQNPCLESGMFAILFFTCFALGNLELR